MKTKAIWFAAHLGLTVPLTALAHGDHSPVERPARDVVNEAKARELAALEVARLVKVKKVPESWMDAEVKTSAMRTTKKSFEWVVTLENPAGAANKKTLYVFVKPNGEISGTNFTGK